MGQPEDCRGGVKSIAISADGQTIVSGGEDGMRMWNREGESFCQSFQDYDVDVNFVAISADGQTILSRDSSSKSVRIWDSNGQPFGSAF